MDNGPYVKGSMALASISVVVNFMGNDYCALPSMQQALGYGFNQGSDFVGVMNGDWGANQTRLYGALYDNGTLYAKAPSASYNACRLNILYVHML